MHKKRPTRTLSAEEIKSYLLTDKVKKEIHDVFMKTYFYDYDKKFIKTAVGKKDVDANVFGRYTHSLQHVVPWIMRHLDLKNSTIVEIGCGPGSSSAAFAHFCKKLTGYDIIKKCIVSAKERARIMGQKNTHFQLVTPASMLKTVKKNHKKGSVDLVLFFAVIEHLTIEERIESLKTAWELLKEGGLLVVVETPNRFTYFDSHTTNLPFFHLLPLDLGLSYMDRSSRKPYIDSMKKANKLSWKKAYEAYFRWGQGASYHEFELALGNAYKDNLVAEGFEQEILNWFGVNTEEELLRYYMRKLKLKVPEGYTRHVLNLIFQKAKNPKNLKKAKTKVPEYFNLDFVKSTVVTVPEKVSLPRKIRSFAGKTLRKLGLRK